ncbi:UDP-N-acetylglucosamine--N-acetylmuramyl-(pentapeptide) pyrophosphoryl-undecaprenol N-acetylglucosamine transferase [candidate division WWE3 bacterium]|nr:UDP-N-acetylglucosamine--N-acetylmuramyl-(pentapeptide) pyrophosphoryl-undecaprenol N-acetylglucosamine transferase [candidate division WWE3 bacterium]
MDSLLPTIAFTGGHHNSALSVAVEVEKRKLAKVIWFGHKFTMLGDTKPSAEFTEVTKNNIPFYDIKAGKVYKTFNLIHWLRLPFGFFQSYWYLMRVRPALVVSFGGYLAAPVVLAAWLQGIPSVTHEQTSVVGLSNRFISLFVKKIFITWPQSKQYFDSEKTVVTGLPLRENIFTTQTSEKLFNNSLPVIYVTGGKQGSHVINMAIRDVLPRLLEFANVIHQSGATTVTNDFEALAEIRKRLPDNLRDRYLLFPYIYQDQIGNIFSQTDLIIARAGAHTVYEVAALGMPALFIPIPWVSHNEQYKNARMLVNKGSAIIVPEDSLTPQSLLQEIKRMLDQKEHYQEHAHEAKTSVIFNAKERMVDELAALLSTETKKY